MAVYTHVGAEDMETLLALYGVGPLLSAKGIAEGVENSNYLVDAAGGRFILTLYEKRVDTADLPFFIALIDHLADGGSPVPRILPDLDGRHVQTIGGRPACLIQFLQGVSVSRQTSRQAYSAGAALADLHLRVADFAQGPANPQGKAAWHALALQLGDRLDQIIPGLTAEVAEELAFLDAHWPDDLPTSVIHADLFPDNVLMMGDEVTGIIDFYFACRDITAYDYAVTHGAWCFSADGSHYLSAIAAGLGKGYADHRPLSDAERDALPVLARGAALRFLLTRSLDWLETPPDALVARKDPLAYHRRLQFYRTATTQDILGQ
jgi:homoserine kinase type II